MPYSFTQIEKDKSKTIGLVFCFLILFYFVTFYLLVFLIKNYLYYEYSRNSRFDSLHLVFFNVTETAGLFLAAIFVGLCHWVVSVNNIIGKILNVLKAESPSATDTYHQMFVNIINEVSVATGGQKIEAVVVPSMAMNAFALSDFSGRAVIGVTEGIISRFSRAQIEAVVGHEAAHIVSGDCLSTTVTSSLFDMYGGMKIGRAHV